MGAKESKQSCISYEDAIKRVSDIELRRLKDAFKKSAGVGRLYLSQKAFYHDVLCEGVPANIAELLFTACGGSSKGITFKELLCGLVLLTRGTEEEKIRFLWNLYCNDAGTYVVKSEFTKAVSLSPHEIGGLFAQGDRVNFELFREWIKKHSQSMVLSKWLLIDACISLTSELETPTFYQSLAGVTHLEEKDISDLEKEFWRLKNSSSSGQLDLALLGPLISPPIPKNALKGLFNAFDENRDGHIDFKELCCGVSAACRGPTVERTRFCFKIFDIDRDGLLNHNETLQLINVLLFVAKENKNSIAYIDLNKQEIINDLLKFTSRKSCHSENGLEEKLNADNISLSPEDFMMWSVESNLKLVQPFLDLVFEVCHIVFGLWPQCKHMEYDIVRGWLKREEKRQYRVGQFWYLISRDWWITWLQYTQNNFSSCEYCKKTFSQKIYNVGAVDEAMVCDESFNSSSLEYVGDAHITQTSDAYSLGSTSSGVSSGRVSCFKPGPIDNTNLITISPYKNIRTLTGEGGHLKRDTPLVQNHDFELVPKSLWKALNRWYSDILPLPRQVIQPPNATEVELELYPLNLRILLHHTVPQNSQMNTWGSVSGGYGVMGSGGGYTAITTSILQPPKRYLAYTAAFSRLATVRQIADFLCEQLHLKAEDIRLWHITTETSDNSTILLEEETLTLVDMLTRDNDQILLEIRNKDLTWPEELGSLGLQHNVTGDRRMTRSSVQSMHPPGATGLHNLGNTCFMNAALQVLFNTQPLAKYFHRNMHLFELNTSNKLGTRGQLATLYGELLKEVWCSSTRSIAPLKLRMCVTKHAPQFSGGGQHDSQELLEWFLDALHEDLNRVTEKPYSELKDSNGRPDKVVAAEAWSQHHARNQSVIIDLFYGQLKSKVSCLCCGKESVRFDPFSLLSLPLPVENFIYFEVLVILLNGSVPTKYGLRLNSESRYIDLKRSLSSLCNLNAELMLVCEISKSQICEILLDEQKIKSSSAKELHVYQLPENCDDQSHSSSIMGLNIENGLVDIQRSSAVCLGQKNAYNETFYDAGQPQIVININKNNNVKQNASAYSHNEDINNIKNGNRGTSEEVSTKVRRCFGNTLCMPQNLLCFKQTAEMSTSPENTFGNDLEKRNSSTMLFCNNRKSSQTIYSNISVEGSIKDELVPDQLHCNGDKEISVCPCRFEPPNKEHLANNITKDACDSKDDMISFNYDTQAYSSKTQHCKVGKYIIAVHRKITRQDTYFLSYHKTRPSLFGVPLLIPNYEGGTQKDLYCAVWLQVSRLLSPLPAAKDQSNHAADCDDSLGYNFPFTLRVVKKDGLNCAVCPWSNFCRGCEISCNNDTLFQTFDMSERLNLSNLLSTTLPALGNVDAPNTSNKSNIMACENIIIAIDWDPTALHLRYQSTLERLWTQHKTVDICRKKQTEPIDLDYCLRAFTSEEKLEQWYHCSHCKGNKPATKKLQIWKLPPILIIHLKRFNCVNGHWVKSQKVVHFPFKDFDPTPYLASVPQETILRHKELIEFRDMHENNNKEQQSKSIEKLAEISEVEVRNTSNKKESEDIYNNEVLKNEARNEQMKSKDTNENKYNDAKRIENAFLEEKEGSWNETNNIEREKDEVKRRRRLVSTSLTKTPVVDGEFEDFHQHKLNAEEDFLDPKYKLYAVVSHSGMLNGGHYISYAANSSGSWYCFNDSSCREISNKPNIDPSSAYLLFYERRGLDYEPYLPDIEGRTLPSEDIVLDTDDADMDLKKLCLLS